MNFRIIVMTVGEKQYYFACGLTRASYYETNELPVWIIYEDAYLITSQIFVLFVQETARS